MRVIGRADHYAGGLGGEVFLADGHRGLDDPV